MSILGRQSRGWSNIPKSWSNDLMTRECSFAKRFSDIWKEPVNQMITQKQNTIKKGKTVANKCKLLICKFFACEEVKFVIN